MVATDLMLPLLDGVRIYVGMMVAREADWRLNLGIGMSGLRCKY